MNAALFSSEKMDWYTPERVLEYVRRVAPIALDPCAGKGSIVNARVQWYGGACDGLLTGWSPAVPRGDLAFVNPPYGRTIGEWLAKCALEWTENRVNSIALVPARVDTSWWHDAVVPYASEICFWRGRIKFLGAPAGAPFPSALIHYGDLPGFRESFADVGWVVNLRGK